MKRFLALLATVVLTAVSLDAAPLRVFIRGGKKSHGPNQHEHERFLNDWKKLLGERGIKTDGAMDWPTAEQFANTDVLVMYAQEGGNAKEEDKQNMTAFIQRGGGVVVIHTAVVSSDPPWWKSVIGGAWVHGKTKWREGKMNLYYQDHEHPISKGASNFEIDDEIYYDLDISPDVRVLATSYTPNVPDGKTPRPDGKSHIYDIQPQMWTYEKTAEGGTKPYRAFVGIPGHLYSTFEKPFYRAILMRAIAWTGGRTNVDEFCKKEELASLRYPEGGPSKPADEFAKLEVHPDFNMKLVAAEPLINKPINFDWDADGRLWVAETPEYPNGRRGMLPDFRGQEWKDHGGIVAKPGKQERPGQDKISILTDTNGDGTMDKKEVFCEGLDLVTGFVFHKDGVIATQAPDVLFIRDTNGDGKADKIEKLYTNLGITDTHAVINNPRWGWDGWIYATHGYAASDDVKSGDGTKSFGRIGAGVVRFKADGSAFEQYSSKGCNTWGLTITDDNRVMWSQPTCGHILMHTVLPEYVLARGKVDGAKSDVEVIHSPNSFPLLTFEEMAYVQIDQVGRFTAASGCAIYDGGSWPAEYNGDFFTTEPTINIVHHERLQAEGPSYKAFKVPGRENTEFVRSNDMWFRPIEVRVGPDGALYVADFYNQAVIHNDTRGPVHNNVNASVRPDRDHYFGRIWKLDHKQAKKLTVPKLTKATAAQLTKALEHPSKHVRMSALRLIAEKGTPAPGLEALMKSGDANTRIAAIWAASKGLTPNKALLASAVNDPDSAVKRNAANIAEQNSELIPAAGIIALLSDPDPKTRIAALMALAVTHLDELSAKMLLAAWPKFDDVFQQSAAIGAASSSPFPIVTAALESKEPSSLLSLIMQLTEKLGRSGNADQLSKLVIAVADKTTDVGIQKAILDKLSESSATPPPMSPELLASLKKLLTGDANSSAVALVAKWDKDGGLKQEVGKLAEGYLLVVKDSSKDDETRYQNAKSVFHLRSVNGDALPAVSELLADKISDAHKKRLVSFLGKSNDPAVGTILIAEFGKLPLEAQNTAFDALLQRADWSSDLLKALQSKTLDANLVTPANAFRLRTHPDKVVADQAKTVLDALQGPANKAKDEILAKLTPEVQKPGNNEKGMELYKTTCATCHKLGDIGTDVGPALTGMGAHGPAELLIHVVDPNRQVEPSYSTWNIEMKDGQLYAGIVGRENQSTLLLKSLAGQIEIKQEDIKTRINTGRSLMPEGLEGIGAEQLRDILSFITSQSKK